MQGRFRTAIAALAALFMVAGCSGTTDTSPKSPGAGAAGSGEKESVRIGFVVSFSGTYAAIAEDQWRGAQLAAEEINKAGGIMGRKIELFQRDDKLDPGEAAKVTQDVIQKEKVHLIVGSMSAATALPINQQAKNAGIPYFGIAQTDKLTAAAERGPGTFHEALTPTMDGYAFGPWIVKNLGKKVYYLMPDYAFGKEHYAAFTNKVKQAGGEEVGLAYFPLGTTDFTSYVAKLRAAKPDVVVTAALGNDQVNFLKQMQSFGLTKEIKFFVSVVDLQSDMAAGFDNIQGTYGGSSFYWELGETVPQAKKFVEAFQTKYKVPPSGYAGYAYSAMYAVKAGAEKAGSFEPDKLGKAMENFEYNFYKGQQKFRGCDHQSLQPMFIVKGRSKAEAEKAGKGQWGFREIVATIAPDESHERSCAELGYK